MSLLQGTLDLLVLKVLQGGPAHGYSIATAIREASDDAFQIEDGALYTALHRLQKRGLLSSEWGTSDNNRRARFYALTRKGETALTRHRSTWSDYSRAVEKVLALGSGDS